MKIRWLVVCLLIFVFALVLGSPQAAFARNIKKVDMPPVFEGDPNGGFIGIVQSNQKDDGGRSSEKPIWPVWHLVVLDSREDQHREEVGHFLTGVPSQAIRSLFLLCQSEPAPEVLR